MLTDKIRLTLGRWCMGRQPAHMRKTRLWQSMILTCKQSTEISLQTLQTLDQKRTWACQTLLSMTLRELSAERSEDGDKAGLPRVKYILSAWVGIVFAVFGIMFKWLMYPALDWICPESQYTTIMIPRRRI